MKKEPWGDEEKAVNVALVKFYRSGPAYEKSLEKTIVDALREEGFSNIIFSKQ